MEGSDLLLVSITIWQRWRKSDTSLLILVINSDIFFTNYGEKHIHTQTSKDECDVFDTNRITQKQHKVYQFQHTRFHHSEEKLYKMTIHDTKCVIF